MLRRGVERGGHLRYLTLPIAVVVSAGCSMAGFGGSLQLNITDLQSREVTIRVSEPSGTARLLEIDDGTETELGTGSAEIDRYVLRRARFGNGVAVGLFLCAKPCSNPLSSYLVAYSPDQIFAPDGQLQLTFRIVPEDGVADEISRTITAEMLPALWETPMVEVGSGS